MFNDINNLISNFIKYWFVLNNYYKLKIILYTYYREMAKEIIDNMREYKYISPQYENFLYQLFDDKPITDELFSPLTVRNINIFYHSGIYDTTYTERELYIFFNSLFKYFIKYNIPITNTQYLFTVFTYVHDLNFIPIAEKIYSDCSDYSRLQINYLFIIIIYLKIEKMIKAQNEITDVLEMDDTKLKNDLELIFQLTKTLIEKKIILNPIISTQEFIDSNELNFVSLFDILAYSVYTSHNQVLVIFFLNLIIELVKNSDSDIKVLSANKINPNTFDFLFKHLDNDDYDLEDVIFSNEKYSLIEKIIEEFDSDSELNYKHTYKYGFLQILNKIYLDLGKEYYFDKLVSQIIISIYNEPIFESNYLLLLSNDSELYDIIKIFSDLNKISESDIYSRYISWIKNSTEITLLKKIYYINAFFRYENDETMIIHDGDSNQYYLLESGNKYPINSSYYYDKCKFQILNLNYNSVMDLLEIMELYVGHMHSNLLELEKIDENNFSECVICLGDIKKIKKVCLECKKCFHKKCIVLWTQKNKSSCPICRRNLSSTMELNPTEKLDLFNILIKSIKG